MTNLLEEEDEEKVGRGWRTTCSDSCRAHRSAPATTLRSDRRRWPAAVRGYRAPHLALVHHLVVMALSRSVLLSILSSKINLRCHCVVRVIELVLRHGFRVFLI